MHGGYSEVYSDCIKMLLKTSEIQIQIVREKHNLPVVFDSSVSSKVKKTLASSMRSGLLRPPPPPYITRRRRPSI
jgi:hypothetical protein